MSRSTSPRSKKRNWTALRKTFAAIDSQQSTDELVPAWRRGELLEPRWAPEYVGALQQSLEQLKHADLLALLDSGMLIHPILLPVLADVLRGALNGSMTGRPILLLEGQSATLKMLFESMVGPNKMRASDFYSSWAEDLGVSADTIERAIKRVDPDGGKSS